MLLQQLDEVLQVDQAAVPGPRLVAHGDGLDAEVVVKVADPEQLGPKALVRWGTAQAEPNEEG